jgi:hypothetical protein
MNNCLEGSRRCNCYGFRREACYDGVRFYRVCRPTLCLYERGVWGRLRLHVVIQERVGSLRGGRTVLDAVSKTIKK